MNNSSTFTAIPLLLGALTLTSNLNAAPYVGFSLGQATIEDACDGFTGLPGVSCDDSDTAFKIYGGSKINPNFAFEVAYIDMGEAVASDRFDTLTSEVTAFNFSALGIIPVSQTVDLFGKVGLLFWDAKISINGSLNGSISEDGTDIGFGFGANFAVNEKFSIRAEFQKFPNIGDDDTIGESAITMLSVGAIISF